MKESVRQRGDLRRDGLALPVKGNAHRVGEDAHIAGEDAHKAEEGNVPTQEEVAAAPVDKETGEPAEEGIRGHPDEA